MAQGKDFGLGHQHPVVLLVDFAGDILAVLRDDQGVVFFSQEDKHVLLVDGQPVFHPAAVVFKQNAGILHKPLD